MYNEGALITAYKERSVFYSRISRFENKYPSSIGFINPTTEIFVVKEKLICRLFGPHFYLYDHETGKVKSFLFSDIDSYEPQILDFFNTVREYSLDRERYPLIRTYYDDLIVEWEIANKCLMKRKFICKL